jgi:hypothetical protein
VLSILHSFFPQHGSISKEQPVHYWLAEGLLLNDCLKGDQIKLRVINLFRSQYGIHDVGHLNLDSLETPMFLGITICIRHVLNKLNKTNPFAKSTYRLILKYCRECSRSKSLISTTWCTWSTCRILLIGLTYTARSNYWGHQS